MSHQALIINHKSSIKDTKKKVKALISQSKDQEVKINKIQFKTGYN